MSASMAEVLIGHAQNSEETHSIVGPWSVYCRCGDEFKARRYEQAKDLFAAHQAEQLAANGYGKLEDDTCCCGTCGL